MPHYTLRSVRRGVGDVLSISALVRDLHLHRPDIRLSVTSGGVEDAAYARDPRIVPPTPDAVELRLDHKPLVDRSRNDKSARYCHAGHEQIEHLVGFAVPRGPNAPSLILGPDETYTRDRPYVVVAAGTKGDIPIKQWPISYWRELVASVPDVEWVQVGALSDARGLHRQSVLPGCVNLLGKTDLRKLFAVIAGASAVVCHLSMPMLVAAAFGVPCVVLAGGREDPWLFESPGVTLLHTVGALDCCPERGCRKMSAVKPHDESAFPANWLCEHPVEVGGLRVGRCMELVTPSAAAAAVKQSLAASHNQ